MSDPAAIFVVDAPRYYTIKSGGAFLEQLADALYAWADSPARLSDALVLLPTRRAVRAAGDAFINAAPNKAATLLPQMKAIGDVDEDELEFFAGDAADEIALPPAILPMARRLALARLIAARDRRYFDGQEQWAGALSAADELGKLLDSFYTEEIDLNALQTIVPEDYAAHWAQSVSFLELVSDAWPKFLRDNNVMDPAARRSALIDAQRRRWEADPPQTPVIIAGTTGSTPAVARMMAVVAQLPLGCVVLPGLDLGATAHVWNAIDEPHPQSGLKDLLARLKVNRDDVKPFPVKSIKAVNKSARPHLLSMALRPAAASDDWHTWAQAASERHEEITASLVGISLIEAADEESEAAAVALKLRGTMEMQNKTIMLVTPDRDLARRVSLKMRRWGIAVDDSAGVPFPNSPCGAYLRLTAAWLSDVSDPLALMALLRHPLFGGGLSDEARSTAITAMDRSLRGVRPLPGVIGLLHKIQEIEYWGPRAAGLATSMLNAAALRPDTEATFAERLHAHIAIAEQLAAIDATDGADRLWRGEDGETGAALVADIAAAAEHITNRRHAEYSAIFDQLIANAVVRRTAPAHPRIAVLGPLEARLQTADVIILGGLNEGVWPRDAAIDPFLSRPMRREIGLPSPERRIGLAAHDFAQLAASGDVMLTRALRSGGAPTKPSRWIVRLKNILTATRMLDFVDSTEYFAQFASQLDRPNEPQQTVRPSPCPPLAARPRDLSVTRIEKLLRDPYAIYASKILRLDKLEPLGATFGAADLGKLFHKVFEEYAKHAATPEGCDASELHALFAQHSKHYRLTPERLAFWRGRIDAALLWFVDWHAHKLGEGAPVVVEGKGAHKFNAPGGPFTLTARADRIDKLKDGDLFIFDYKTGAPPTLKQNVLNPQLPLTGFIAREGGFPDVTAAPIGGFAYVRVLSRTSGDKDDVIAIGADVNNYIDEAEAGLRALVAHFDDPKTTYPSQPRAEFVDQYGEYDHLARRRERDAGGGEE